MGHCTLFTYDSHFLHTAANHQHSRNQHRPSDRISNHETSKHLDIHLCNNRGCELESGPSRLCLDSRLLRERSLQILRALQELCHNVTSGQHQGRTSPGIPAIGSRRYTIFGLHQIRRGRILGCKEKVMMFVENGTIQTYQSLPQFV